MPSTNVVCAAKIAVVISNRGDAGGLESARAAGIETLVVDHRSFPTRDAFDRALSSELGARRVSLVCLAGFMRLVGTPLLEAFPNAILNVHPSLLPAFPGVDAQRQALEHGVKVAGASVHLVTAELDGGPIVLQAAVPVRDDDTAETLAARILIEEHRIYPEAARSCFRRLDDRRPPVHPRARFLPDPRNQSVAHARRILPVSLQVRLQERVFKEHSAHHQQRTAEADRKSNPRSERQAAERHGRNHSGVSGVPDDGVGP